MEPGPFAVRRQSPNHQTTREFPDLPFNQKSKNVLCVYISNFKKMVQFSSVIQSCWLLQPHGLQHTRPPSCPSPTPGVYSNSCPLSWQHHWTISFSVIPFLSTFSLSQHQGLFKQVSSSHEMAKVSKLQLQLQHQSFQWIFRTDVL